MMHAFLIIGASRQTRQVKIQQLLSDWNIAPIDIVAISDEHIGIDNIRSFQKQLLLTPSQSPYHIGIMYQASTITIEAQNALLKLLEEPPAKVRIILETDSDDLLLPTIVSRCVVMHISGENEGVDIPLMSLMDAPIGKKLTLLEAYSKDRLTAKAFVADALFTAEKLLRSGKDAIRVAALIRRLQQAQAQLAVNCNPKLVLDRAFLFGNNGT